MFFDQCVKNLKKLLRSKYITTKKTFYIKVNHQLNKLINICRNFATKTNYYKCFLALIKARVIIKLSFKV